MLMKASHSALNTSHIGFWWDLHLILQKSYYGIMISYLKISNRIINQFKKIQKRQRKRQH